MTDVAVSEKMDPAVKLLWLDALRSGEFDQAKGRLAVIENEETKGFCCLGVLCELAVREGVIEPGVRADEYDIPMDTPDHDSSRIDRLIYGDLVGRRPDDYSSTELPNAVRDWAKLDKHTPEVIVPRAQEDIDYDLSDGIDNPDTTHSVSVAELNDDQEWNFTAIADAIEKDL